MMALSKKKGQKPTDFHRMLWALGFAAYTEHWQKPKHTYLTRSSNLY
ncbi:MAG: hypothetical protein ACMG55_16985 [Microcoleus sp.]